MYIYSYITKYIDRRVEKYVQFLFKFPIVSFPQVHGGNKTQTFICFTIDTALQTVFYIQGIQFQSLKTDFSIFA